jgi:uncharacterized membrane protein YfcA
MVFLLLLLLGFAVGVYGALIGVGGGFILLPFLLFLYPLENTGFVTGISLAVVFVNALSGSVAYARMGRIDYRSGLIFSLATIPGAIMGALSTAYIPRRAFDLIFGSLLMAVSILLMVKPQRKEPKDEYHPRFRVWRKVREKNGVEHTFSYNYLTGTGFSFFIGYFSSVLGIGGGIIHVPVLVYLLHFPVQIATATSLFILMVTAGTGTGVHMFTGTFFSGLGQTAALAVGVLFGAPLGAGLSRRIQDYRLIRALAFAMVLVGIRTVMAAF